MLFFNHIAHPFELLEIIWSFFTLARDDAGFLIQAKETLTKWEKAWPLKANEPRFCPYYVHLTPKLLTFSGVCDTNDWQITEALWVAFILLKFWWNFCNCVLTWWNWFPYTIQTKARWINGSTENTVNFRGNHSLFSIIYSNEMLKQQSRHFSAKAIPQKSIAIHYWSLSALEKEICYVANESQESIRIIDNMSTMNSLTNGDK